MPRTLFGKLLCVFLGFGAVMTIAFIIVMRTFHVTYHLELDQAVNREVAREYVASHFAGDGSVQPDLTGAVRHLATLAPAVDAYLLDANGAIVAASVARERWQREAVAVAPLEDFISGAAVLPILADDPLAGDRQVIFSAAAIDIPSWPARYLYLVLNRHQPSSDVLQIQRNYAISQHTGIIAIAVLFAVLATLVIIRSLTRNLARLERAMEEFRRSDFTRLPGREGSAAPEDDEIGRLTRLFGELAVRIQQQIGELKGQSELRREFMANISHDLRTPLTSLQAHLDTLHLKEKQLTAQESSSYLEGAIRHCRRLRRLVEQLFEAERLDAHQIHVNAEPFQLRELVQDVVQKFDATARERGVRLQAHLSDTVPLIVADVGLIERALDNLIDNALRFTPRDGCVTVEVTRARTVYGSRSRTPAPG
ncbi:MAG: HAMP domain-containing histidine kinase [Gammaproteobacteria bacterium]|nr:HAMP domain-containing histidine kinase [Gammaproteobacteria bacterium]